MKLVLLAVFLVIAIAGNVITAESAENEKNAIKKELVNDKEIKKTLDKDEALDEDESEDEDDDAFKRLDEDERAVKRALEKLDTDVKEAVENSDEENDEDENVEKREPLFFRGRRRSVLRRRRRSVLRRRRRFFRRFRLPRIRVRSMSSWVTNAIRKYGAFTSSWACNQRWNQLLAGLKLGDEEIRNIKRSVIEEVDEGKMDESEADEIAEEIDALDTDENDEEVESNKISLDARIVGRPKSMMMHDATEGVGGRRNRRTNMSKSDARPSLRRIFEGRRRRSSNLSGYMARKLSALLRLKCKYVSRRGIYIIA